MPAMTPKPGQTLSHYRLIEEIGQGGMGVVFRALDTKLGRHVALKMLPAGVAADADRLRRFQAEARSVAALNHPNIVTIHSVEEADGVHFLTMELVEGPTLAALIPRGGMALGTFFDIAVPLAEALSAAHERGIVHRDLKPSNVMVTGDGRVKILDFGLAKLWKQEATGPATPVPEPGPTRTILQDSGVTGTIPYLSPEQLLEKEADQRSDIFSLGIVLYEMAAGERPFKGESPAAVTSSILRDTPVPVVEMRRELPGLLGRVVRRCLEKDPRRRYQSALDVRNDLEEVRAEIGGAAGATGAGASAGVAAGAPGMGAPAPPARAASGRSEDAPRPAAGARGVPGHRGRVLAIAAIVALVLVAAGIAVFMRGRGATPGERTPAGAATKPAGATAPASIAILPFVNMSDDKENEYFSDGITEELINALVKLKGLKVPARTSVFALKGKGLTVREIGDRLGVDAVVEGSVRKSGDKLRITAQLINVADGYHLWSETYDRTLQDVFAIQEEIAQSIVRALQVTLDPAEERALQKTPPRDVQAYDYYLRGRTLFHLAGRKNYESARAMFARAIEIDPRYALGYAGIADVSSFLYMYADSSEENLEQARGASAKALELAPDLAEAHASRGVALSLSRKYAEAEREFETAMRLDPKLFEAPYFYGRNCWSQGKLEQAARLFELASSLRPDDYQSLALLVSIYSGLKRQADATAARERAMRVIQSRLESEPDDVRAIYLYGGLLVASGRAEEGIRYADRALAIDPHDPATLYNVACLYSVAGRVQKAIGALGQAIDAGFAQREWIENDRDLDPLRNDPRFKDLLKRMQGQERQPR